MQKKVACSKKKVELKHSRELLYRNLETIKSVSEWAEKMGYSNVKEFSRKFRNKYGIQPREVLIFQKVQQAIYLLHVRPDLSCYEIAHKIGKTDEKALNCFIKKHTGNPPTYYRRKIK